MQMKCKQEEIPEETYGALQRVQAMLDVFFAGKGFIPDRLPEAIPAEASAETFTEVLTDLLVAMSFHGEPDTLISLARERAEWVLEAKDQSD